jgi:beclin 1
VRQRGAFTPREKEEAETRKVEAELKAELTKAADLRLELDDLRRERLGLEAESNDLDARESAYWDDFNDFKLALERHVDERDSLVVSVEQTGRQLERLRRTNVFNDAFHVWFDGPFGTVNGFRLGRLPNVAVEWDEINAAWGMTCLLLSTMANAVKLEFTQYTLQPMGSFSKVLDKKGELHFYSRMGN